MSFCDKWLAVEDFAGIVQKATQTKSAFHNKLAIAASHWELNYPELVALPLVYLCYPIIVFKYSNIYDITLFHQHHGSSINLSWGYVF